MKPEAQVSIFDRLSPQSTLYGFLKIHSLKDLIVMKSPYLKEPTLCCGLAYEEQNFTDSRFPRGLYLDAHFTGYQILIDQTSNEVQSQNIIFRFEGFEIGRLKAGQSQEWITEEITGNWINLRSASKANLIEFVRTRSRLFNKIQIRQDSMTKKIDDPMKFNAEILYYQNLPEQLKPYFPLPIQNIDRTNQSYDLRFVPALDFSISQIHNSLSPSEMNEFLEVLGRYLQVRPEKPNSQDQNKQTLLELGVTKLLARIDQLEKSPVSKDLDRNLQKIAGVNFRPWVDQVAQRLGFLIEHSEPENMRWIHGDLCFCNILWDRMTKSMTLVDPRGFHQQNEGWGPPIYDLAKLAQSGLRNGDFIINKTSADSWNSSESRKVFQSWLGKQSSQPQLLHAMTASLMISLLPLHLDSPETLPFFMTQAFDAFTASN